MKILVVCQFDPCGVAAGHAVLMRAAGHDYRVVTGAVPEWLVEFARAADVIQVCPGIGNGDGWSTDASATFMDEKLAPPPSFRGRRVAYFHGSVATWVHREQYAKHCRDLGFALATSTLDYAYELPAAYLPPYLDPVTFARAELRDDSAPLVIAHTPTNPANCHTAEFFGLMQRLSWNKLSWNKKQAPIAEFVTGRPHEEALHAKARAHAYFDHLRGSFSVNTLEACAMGLVPLVGLLTKYAEREVLPALLPRIETYDDLKTVVTKLCDEPWLTRELQLGAREWFMKNFNADVITGRLVRFYEGL